MLSLRCEKKAEPAHVPSSRSVAQEEFSFVASLPVVPRGIAKVHSDGRLQVGEFVFVVETVEDHLRALNALCKRIERFVPDKEALFRILPDGALPMPEDSLDIAEAWRAFEQVQEGRGFAGDLKGWMQKFERLAPNATIGADDLKALRHLFIEGARVATVCTAIDDALCQPPPPVSFPVRMMAHVRSFLSSGSWTSEEVLPRASCPLFEVNRPGSLRLNLDAMAQRLQLLDDGSPWVREGCFLEHQAAELLKKHALLRDLKLGEGGLEGTISLVSNDDGKKIFSKTVSVAKVFWALKVGHAASLLIRQLQEADVDLVRLCGLVDEERAKRIGECLNRISLQTHLRLDDVPTWQSRFDALRQDLSSDTEKRELAMLLMDAELTTRVAAHLQGVVGGEGSARFWRAHWRAAKEDTDIRVAVRLAQAPPPPLHTDCAEAAYVTSNAALLLGFSGGDRPAGSWRPYENTVVSLAWSIRRASDGGA